jgi:uncharacterized membrane protein HdeD (DUF308 family)
MMEQPERWFWIAVLAATSIAVGANLQRAVRSKDWPKFNAVPFALMALLAALQIGEAPGPLLYVLAMLAAISAIVTAFISIRRPRSTERRPRSSAGSNRDAA